MLKLASWIVLASVLLHDGVVSGARFKISLSDDFRVAYQAHRMRRFVVSKYNTACADVFEVERESLTLRGNLSKLHERVKFYRSTFATEHLKLIYDRSVPGLGSVNVGEVLDVLRKAECYPFLFGGGVRDQFLGRVPRDVDVEVDCSIERLLEVCVNTWGAHNCRRSTGSPIPFAHIGNETLGEGLDIDLASTDLFFFSPPSALEYTVNSLVYETSGDDVIIDLSGTGNTDVCDHIIRIPSDDGSEESWDEWRSSITKVYRFWKLREKKLKPFNNATLEYIVRYATIDIEENPENFYNFYCDEVFDIDYNAVSHSCPAPEDTCESGLENAFDFHRAFREDFMDYWDTLQPLLPSTVCNICDLPADFGAGNDLISRYYFNYYKGICQEFTFGGADGNQNNFESLQDCNDKCNPNNCPPYCTVEYCSDPQTRRSMCTFSGPAPQGSFCTANCRITYCHTCYYGDEHRPNPGNCETCPYYPDVSQAGNRCFKRWAVCTRRANAQLYPKARGRSEKTEERFKCYEHPCQAQ